jgi:hypothetical protein
MRIALIAPAWDLVREKKGSRIFLLAPLTFPVLAALTPENIEIEIIEERLQPKNYTGDELHEGFLRFMNDFFSYGSIFKRPARSRTQLLLGILANMGYHKFYSRLFREYEETKSVEESDDKEIN